jgi:ATP-binding cassette subfamily B protein
VVVGLALLCLLAAAGSTLALPVALRALIDQGIGAGLQGQAMAGYFGGLMAVAAALAVFSALRYYTVTWLGERITGDLRHAVYAHVLRQSPVFFESTPVGEVLSRLGNDTTLIQTVVGSSLSMGLRNVVMGAGALLMLVYTNPWLMLQVLALMLLVVWPSAWLGRRVRRLSRANQDRMADSSAMATEVLGGIAVVQSVAAEGREAARFGQAVQQTVRAALRRARARAVLVGFIILTTSAALLWGLYLGVVAVQEGRTSAGMLGQTVVYIVLLASAVAVIGEVYGDLQRAAGATERLMELLGTHTTLPEPAYPVALPPRANGAALALQGVGFRYPSRPHTWALQRITAQVQPGQTVAVVGPSGAGKTTLFQLLLRFYDPEQGHIALDGVPLPQLGLAQLRQRVGVVPQEPVLFAGSAHDNIAYADPNASAARVQAAARAAHAHEFIEALPQGYQTELGERGVRLSGGQRQRIAIARALLKNPPLLLLDEATSALDAHSEQVVQQALESAMQGRTTLVIAHRLATVQKADVIWVLDHGQLVETGTHAQLRDQGGLYASLAALQFHAAEPA